MIVIHNRLSTLDQEGGNEYEKTVRAFSLAACKYDFPSAKGRYPRRR